MNKLVSIIIPAYNAEKTVGNALLSAYLQSYPNIEIIVIDDGSTDETFEVCKKMIADQDNKSDNVFHGRPFSVSLVRTENQGVSRARNLGISMAKGDYLVFLDADDSLKIDIIKTCIDKTVSINYPVIAFNTVAFTREDGKYEELDDMTKQFRVTDRGHSLKTLHILKTLPATVWGKMFLTKFIRRHHIEFPDLTIAEDAYFYYLSMMHSWDMPILQVDTTGYYYCVSSSSTMGAIKNEAPEKSLDIALDNLRMCDKLILEMSRDRRRFIFFKDILKSTVTRYGWWARQLHRDDSIYDFEDQLLKKIDKLYLIYTDVEHNKEVR